MTSATSRLVRVSRSYPCPKCGRPDWCMISTDGAVAICPRTPSPRWVGKNGGGGYLHYLNGQAVPVAAPARKQPPKSKAEIVALMKRYATSVNPLRLEKLAAGLGLTVASLRRLGIGWASDWNAWAFPMCDAEERIVGVRLRTDDGRKFAVTGGHAGLCIPADLPTIGPLLFCEGPTSCAALLDLGFEAVGRPSCMGGVELVCDLLRRFGRRDVIIFGDRDEAKKHPDGSVWFPGQDGARKLAQEVLPLARSVKVLIPPFVKDPRDWKKSGATRGVVEAVIRAANYVRKDPNHGR